MLRGGTGERLRGDGRVPHGASHARIRTRSPAGCRWAALLLAPASPLPDSLRYGSRGAESFGDQVRCGQRLVPWASAFRSLSPKLRARNLHARTPSRQYQKSRRGSR